MTKRFGELSLSLQFSELAKKILYCTSFNDTKAVIKNSSVIKLLMYLLLLGSLIVTVIITQ